MPLDSVDIDAARASLGLDDRELQPVRVYFSVGGVAGSPLTALPLPSAGVIIRLRVPDGAGAASSTAKLRQGSGGRGSASRGCTCTGWTGRSSVSMPTGWARGKVLAASLDAGRDRPDVRTALSGSGDGRVRRLLSAGRSASCGTAPTSPSTSTVVACCHISWRNRHAADQRAVLLRPSSFARRPSPVLLVRSGFPLARAAWMPESMTTGRDGGHDMIDDVLATLERSGFVEGLHYGRLVVLGPSDPRSGIGESPAVRLAVGDILAPFLLRSVCKPLQAVAVLRSGVDLRGSLLALATSSHSGEPYHQRGVETLLERFGLDASALLNIPGLPLDPRLREEWTVRSRPPTRLAHNCSGKHAAMLAACVVNSWPLDSYREIGHPLQELVLDTVRDLTGQRVAAVAVDGCGTPVPAVSPIGVARAFARIATAPKESPEGWVAGAMRQYPEWVAGTERETTKLMRAVPGLIIKEGAEAVAALAFPDGAAAAFKISDGAQRARTVVTARVLRHLGRPYDDTIAPATLPVLGGGQVVGGLRASFPIPGV